jgi:hypothetical protein
MRALLYIPRRMRTHLFLTIGLLTLFSPIAPSYAQSTDPFQSVALGVDVNLVTLAGPGIGAGVSGRYKHFGFGAYAATQGVNGIAQRLSFSEVGPQTTTGLPMLVNVRLRYHLFERPTGPYAAVDVGGEMWSLQSGEERASIVNAFVVPKLGFQWFPFQKDFRAKVFGGLFLGISVGAIFIVAENRTQTLPDGPTTLRPILFNPELFVGWWW